MPNKSSISAWKGEVRLKGKARLSPSMGFNVHGLGVEGNVVWFETILRLYPSIERISDQASFPPTFKKIWPSLATISMNPPFLFSPPQQKRRMVEAFFLRFEHFVCNKVEL
ncbi:hypothetical protein AMTRI_Chr03g54240 [Amborella trichopoda]